MPAPRISKDHAKRYLAKVEEFLRAGHPPPGIGVADRNTRGAIRMACDFFGVCIGGNGNHHLGCVRQAGREPNWKLWKRVDRASNIATPAEEKFRLQETIRVLKSELTAARRENLNAANVREAIYGLANHPVSSPNWLVDPRGRHKSAPGIPTAMWSDWHWGEVVVAEEVAGVNEYNLATAHRRAKALVERTIDLCFHHMTSPTYPGIVVCLGGDMISGEIHDDLIETNEIRTAPALLDLQGVLIWALQTMADKFGRVFVPCVVGNHGRMTHKPRAKQRIHTNFEWLLYCQLERHFKNDKRIQFAVPLETDVHFRVYNHRYMLTHGDSLGVRGGDGIIGAIGPIMRGRVKTATSEARIGRDFDTMIIGHWHQYIPTRRVIVNSSLKGYDDYARLFLRSDYEPASQALWFTHPQRGVTCHWQVYVDDAPQKPAFEWVSWKQA